MSRLGELTGKVDAFFARVTDRHGTDMQCSTGCSDCCHVRLTITGVEAAAIRAEVATWSPDDRRNLADTGAADRCAALDPAGRCKIYDARPLVCRSHGVPIRLRQGGQPMVQACHRNFRHTSPDPDCVLDQTTLSAMLLAVDVAEARAAGAADVAGARGETDRPGPANVAGGPGPSVPTGLSGLSGPAGPASPSGPAGPASPSGPIPPSARRVELARLLADLAAI